MGLVVEWKPPEEFRSVASETEWVMHPITTNGGLVVPLAGVLKQRWITLHTQLSEWPGSYSVIGSWLKWARSVGNTYIAKSDRSWALRLQGGSIKTRLSWLIWSFMPITLLLRFGAWFPDSKALALELAFEEDVMDQIAAGSEWAVGENSKETKT